VGHDLDEPWPLEIEDHEGNIHAVNIEAGEMVMYESAKQYHARLTPMRGKHYGSVFIHFYPKHGWNWTMWDVHVIHTLCNAASLFSLSLFLLFFTFFLLLLLLLIIMYQVAVPPDFLEPSVPSNISNAQF
jgi:hypothetical protein